MGLICFLGLVAAAAANAAAAGPTVSVSDDGCGDDVVSFSKSSTSRSSSWKTANEKKWKLEDKLENR